MSLAVKDRGGRAGSDSEVYYPYHCGICSVAMHLHDSSRRIVSCQSCKFLFSRIALFENSIILQHMKDHLVLFFVLLTGKLYAIGMLYTLNSRVMLRERMRSNDFGRTSLGTWQWDQDSRTTRNLGSLSEVTNSVSYLCKAQFHFISPRNRLMRLQPCALPGHVPTVELRQFTQTSRPPL